MLASDLVFEGRRMGSGSQVFAAKFELMCLEEKSRACAGVSTWRTCLFLSDYMSRLDTEGRLSDIKGNGERLMRAMTEDSSKMAHYELEFGDVVHVCREAPNGQRDG